MADGWGSTGILCGSLAEGHPPLSSNLNIFEILCIKNEQEIVLMSTGEWLRC